MEADAGYKIKDPETPSWTQRQSEASQDPQMPPTPALYSSTRDPGTSKC